MRRSFQGPVTDMVHLRVSVHLDTCCQCLAERVIRFVLPSILCFGTRCPLQTSVICHVPHVHLSMLSAALSLAPEESQFWHMPTMVRLQILQFFPAAPLSGHLPVKDLKHLGDGNCHLMSSQDSWASLIWPTSCPAWYTSLARLGHTQCFAYYICKLFWSLFCTYFLFSLSVFFFSDFEFKNILLFSPRNIIISLIMEAFHLLKLLIL